VVNIYIYRYSLQYILLLVILHRHLNGYIEFNIHSISKNVITIDYISNQKMFTIY